MKSHYQNRNTVGSIYLDAQKNSSQGLILGDVGSEMVSGLIDDLNETIQSDPFDGREFYINVVEERDLQMKNAIKRRLFVSIYRPYPEDNTLVFKADPKSNRIFYCWDVPHHSELPNILSREDQFPHDYIRGIKQWMGGDLTSFGFLKVSMNSSQVEGVPEKTVQAYRNAYWEMCKGQGMDEKQLESEKRVGYFWIPNPNYKDQPLDQKQQVSLIDV